MVRCRRRNASELGSTALARGATRERRPFSRHAGVPAVKLAMPRAAGGASTDDFLEDVPEIFTLGRPMSLAGERLSRCALRQYLEVILPENATGRAHLRFLGAGCWRQQSLELGLARVASGPVGWYDQELVGPIVVKIMHDQDVAKQPAKAGGCQSESR